MQPKQLVGKRGKAGPKPTLVLTEQQQKYLKIVKRDLSSSANTFKKAYTGRSLAAGIKAMCLSCTNLQPLEVKRCNIEGCPLWVYRPYRGGK